MFRVKSLSHKENLHIWGLSIFLFLYGSHILYDYTWVFLFASFFFIDWKRILSFESGLLLLLILSLYGLYINTHRSMFQDPPWAFGVATEVVMVITFYLMGLSIKYISNRDHLHDKSIFYALYGFFIAYCVGIIYSYIFIAQNHEIPTSGFSVFYATKGLHFHSDGKIAVTIVGYFLAFLVVLIPFIIFRYREFKEKKFANYELLIIFSIAVYSFYIANFLGRRVVLLVSLLFLFYFIIKLLVSNKLVFSKRNTLLILSFILLFLLSYYLMKDTTVIERIILHNGFTDSRMLYWAGGLDAMMNYPYGGGKAIRVIEGYYATNPHNFWIGIGKSYGIAAFVTSVAFYLFHVKYIIRILRNKNVSFFIKDLIIIISCVIFILFMIESIFHTEKSLFFYSIFFLGFLKSYSDTYSDIEKSATLS